LVQRARIILMAADGIENQEIAWRLRISRPTVQLWRQRFLALHTSGLEKDAPRPGRIPRIRGAKIAAIVEATLHTKPPQATHWSTRAMAKAQGVSEATVRRIWRQHHLQPHRVETFRLSRDPKFVEKLVDVVGLYLNPPDKALVLCVDEKSQIQALDRTQPGLPMKPGRCGTMTHDYKRHGTTTLFAALSLLDGKVIGDCMPRHRHQEFLKFLRRLDQEFPGQTPPAPRDGQLWDTQASQGASLAQRTSSFSPALCADEFQLVESGGTVVWRTHFQTSPTWILQQRKRPAKGYWRVSGGLE
jgi:hypothetical protein